MDNIFGVTPIESAFEVIGLTNCYAITSYLFRETLWGSLFLSIGFFISLWKFFSTKSFIPVIRFLIIVFILTSLFIIPATNLNNISSTMEVQGGYQQIKAQNIYSSVSANNSAGSILAFTSRLINNLVLGVTGVIDKLAGSDGFNYLKSPFLMNKVMIHMQSYVSAPITDKVLDNQLNEFINKYYLPTLNKMEESGLIDTNNAVYLWPGKGFVVSNYTAQGVAAWQDIYKKLQDYVVKSGVAVRYKKYVEQITKIQGLNPIAENFARKESEKDLLIIAILNKKFIDDAAGRSYSVNTGLTGQGSHGAIDDANKFFQFKNNYLAGFVAIGGEYLAHFFSSVGLQFFLTGLPYLQGLLSLLLFSMFPAVIILCILTSSFNHIILFLKTLIHIKSWHIVLAIICNASRFVLEIQARLMPTSGYVIDRPIYNIITFLFMIASPALSYFLINGILEGVGGVSSALLAAGSAAATYLSGKYKAVRGVALGAGLDKLKRIIPRS